MGWSTQEFIQYMLAAFLISYVLIWLFTEAIGHYVDYNYSDSVPYVPSHLDEGFINRTPSTIMITEPTDIGDVSRFTARNYDKVKSPDMGILRAQRFYDLPEGDTNGNKLNYGSRLPPSRLFSVTHEMPTTYMINLLNNIRDNQPNIELDTRGLAAALRTNPPQLTLQQLQNMEHENIQNNDILATLFTQIRMHIISKINEAAIRSKQSHPAHPFQLFQIIKSWNIGIEKPQAAENTLRFKVNIVIYRGQATHTFNIQAWIDIPGILPVTRDAVTEAISNAGRRRTDAYIHTLELVGSDMSYDGVYSDQQQPLPDSNGYTMAPLSTKRIPPELAKYGLDHAMDNSEAVNVNLNTQIERFLYNKAAERQRLGFDTLQLNIDTQATKKDLITAAAGFDQQLYGPYKCFIIDKQGEVVHLDRVLDPQECQSYHSKYESVGVWDRPCTRNEDCPFFGANSNNPEAAKLGGCQMDTGKCQMPEGVVRVGYRQYAKNSRPRCYQCSRLKGQGELEQDDSCCEEQKKAIDRGEIIDMSSPDYKFAGDGRVNI